jgi:hypothetical protein
MKGLCEKLVFSQSSTGNCIFVGQKKSNSGSQHVADEGSREKKDKKPMGHFFGAIAI